MSDRKTYLGDGIYADWDGNGLLIRAGEDDLAKTVYLRTEHLQRLVRFFAGCRALYASAEEVPPVLLGPDKRARKEDLNGYD